MGRPSQPGPRRGGAGGGGQAAAAYYADGPEGRGRWVSAGAMNVAVNSHVTREQLIKMLKGKDPDTNEQYGRVYKPAGTYLDRLGVKRQRKQVCAYDTTYSIPKTVSAAWALADDETRKQIELAFDESVETVVAYLQQHAVSSRRGTNGVDEIGAGSGATVARFDHTTSRAGDPQLHAHLLWANRVLCDDGVWRTLDGRKLYKHAKAASMAGAAVLRASLSQRLGWSWDRAGQHDHCEIAGVPDELAAHWSQRRRAMERDAARRVREFEDSTGREPTIDERTLLWDQAQKQTRTAKAEMIGPDPHAAWRDEAAEIGIDADKMIEALRTARRAGPQRYDRPELLVDQAPDRELALHLLAAAEEHAIGLDDTQLDEVAYAAINATSSVAGGHAGVTAAGLVHHRAGQLRRALRSHLVHADNKWWSPGIMASETAVMDWFARPADTLVDPDHIDVDGLTDDQAAAVAELAAATTNGLILVGPAGTGKTMTLRPLCDAIGTQRVVAAAPTAVAAANLGTSLDVRGETVAKLLVSDNPVPHGGLVVVDEAGQLSTRGLAALCGKASKAGARVLLVGDPAQQNSVAAGGLFDALARADRGCVTSLHELKRFKDPNEAAATVLIRSGNIAGLDYYTQAGRISEFAANEIATAAADWWEQRRAVTTVVAAPTRDITNEINVEIAQRRAAAGETGKAVIGSGDRTIRTGDLITTRRNDRKLVASDGQWVRNGERWTVTGGRNGTLKARREGGKATIELPAAYSAKDVQLGYAITTTRAQSLTVDAGLCIVTANSNLPQLYVGLTRGRRANNLMVVTDQPSFDADTPPEHTPANKILNSIFDRRIGWRTSINPQQPPAPTQPADQYLQLIGTVDETTPLPAMPGLDVAAHVARRGTLQDDTAFADSFEADIDADIDAWLLAEHEIEIGGEPSSDDWQWYKDQTPPTPDADPNRPPTPAEPEQWENIEQWAEPSPEEWLEPGEPAPSDDEWEAEHERLMNEYIERDQRRSPVMRAAGLDTPEPHEQRMAILNAVTRSNLESTAAAGQDNPWLARLVAKRAALPPDHPGAQGLLALIAAVADTPLRDALRATHQLPALEDGDLAWARDVRHTVIASRAERLRPHLEDIQAHHDRIFSNVEHSGTPRWAQAAQHSRSEFDFAILQWLDSGAPQSRLWNLSNRVIGDMADAAVADTQLPAAADTQLPAAADTPSTPTWADAAANPPPQPAPVDTTQAAADATATPQRVQPPAPANALTQAAGTAADYYHSQLLGPKGRKARQYLLSRGIGPDEWEKWNIGWASGPPQMAALLGEDTAVETGLARHPRDGEHRDHLRYRITLPITDAAGNVISIAGRTLSTNPDVPKYINTTNTATYDKSTALYGVGHAAPAIQHAGEAVIVEGYLDVIAAHRAGIANTVAACGTAVTGDHLATLQHAGSGPTVTVVLDGDTAGRDATRSAMATAEALGWAANAVLLPEGADPDSLPADELRHRIANSAPNPWATLTLAARDILADLNPDNKPRVFNLNQAYNTATQHNGEPQDYQTAAANGRLADLLITTYEAATALDFGIDTFDRNAAQIADDLTDQPSPAAHPRRPGTPQRHSAVIDNTPEP